MKTLWSILLAVTTALSCHAADIKVDENHTGHKVYGLPTPVASDEAANKQYVDDHAGGGGSVTSVGLSAPNIFSVSGSPVTSTGTLTLTLATQSANTVFAGPTTGSAAAPTFRSLVLADIPNLTSLYEVPLTFSQSLSRSTNTVTLNGDSASPGNSKYYGTDSGGTKGFFDLPGNQTITLSGDVTGSGTTAITTTLGNIPDATTAAGSILFTDIAAPSSPSASHLKIFGDSTDLRFHDKNAAGTIGTTVVNDTGATHNFLTAISAAGVISKSQPTEADLSMSDITTNNVSTTQHGFAPKAPNDATKYLDGTGAYSVPAGSVTSVGLSAPNIFSVSGSPVTSTGTLTLTLATQSANTVWAGPTTGSAAAPTFRSLVLADIPSLTSLYEVPLTFSQSLSRSTNTVTLNGDSASPGNSKYYGTDSGGTKGYFSLPATGGNPGGSNTQFQYNNGGAFGGIPSMTYDGTIPATITLAPAANTGIVGLLLQDTQTASSGNQFLSPSISLLGHGFLTGTGDMVRDWRIEVSSIDQADWDGGAKSYFSIYPMKRDGTPSPYGLAIDSNGNVFNRSDAQLAFAEVSALDTVFIGNPSQVQMTASAPVMELKKVSDGTYAPLFDQFAIDIQADAATNATAINHYYYHRTSGTPTVGFGNELDFVSNDSTTADITLATQKVQWTTATHNSNVSDIVFQLLNGSTTLATAGTIKGAGVYDSPVGYRINGAATIGNVLRGNGTNFVSAQLGYSDLSGTPTIPTGANPTASVGLSAVNGSASTFLRSDGAPALSQAIVPTWTGTHVFNQNPGANLNSTAVSLSNTATASSGNQQFSPSLKFLGNGWSSTNSASRTVDFMIANEPVQGTGNPTGTLVFREQVNNGGYVDAFKIGTGTNGNVPSASVGPNNPAAIAGTINVTGILIGAVAASGKILQADGSSFVASAFTLPTTAGTKGANLRSDGTNIVNVSVPYGVVTSTVDQTATTETAHVIYTVPANSAAAGTTYRITAWGNIDNGTTAITFTPRIRWGGTGGTQLIATPTIVGTTTSQTLKTWRAVSDVTIRTIGATGTAFCSLTVNNHTASTTGLFAEDQADSTGTGVTIDTTANKDLDLTWALSATTGTPHIRTYGGFVEIIN